ncbi:MAG TPA: hypothetical protein VN441_14305 [Syntrophomonas sp.]|nr:hypothetical protein [Syntrophomonas sp.]
MAFIWSFIIAGVICAIGQLLAEVKVPKPLLLGGFLVLGGLLTPFGVIDSLSALGSGGVNILACGLGSAGFGTAIQLCSGTFAPLLIVLLLLIVLIGMGAVAGNIYYRKYPDKL